MRFEDLLVAQAGRFTRGQAREHGISSYRIGRRIEAGEWQVVRGRVLALTAVRDGPDSRDWEALLSCGHPDAGGALVIRRAVADRDLLLRDNLLLTDRPQTVLDCARLLPADAATALVERALQQRWLSYDELVLRTQLASGSRGVAQLVAIVRALGSGARSDSERRLVSGLRRVRLPGWHCNLEVCDGQGLIGIVDTAFPAVRLAVELDGRAWHVDRDRFQRDRSRQNRLVAAGWTVQRFTWEDVVHRLDAVRAEIAAVRDQLARAR